MPPYLVRPELRWNGEAATLSAKRKKRQHLVVIIDNEDFAGYTPDVDGAVLPETVEAALADG